MCSGVCNISYMVSQTTPLLLPACWSVVFMVLNLYHISKIFQERKGAHFSEEEMHLYDNEFRGSPMPSFFRLMSKANWVTLEPGTVIVEQGKPNSHLSLITEGVAEISFNGHKVGAIQAGSWVGDIQYLDTDGDEAPAAISATTRDRVRVVRLPWHEVRVLSAEDVSMGCILEHKLAKSVIRKLSLTAQHVSEHQGAREVKLDDAIGKMRMTTQQSSPTRLPKGSADMKKAYTKLLRVVLSDGHCSEEDAELLGMFRQLAEIDSKTHEECLVIVGWAEKLKLLPEVEVKILIEKNVSAP